ncbi:DUF4129 domain-containing protein [Haloarcula litorea]|uniref:DUF4129 domain-containing protein n=1 Tax=Haloarcula litorea TaxID=3032579 RepID=UPI0023E8F5A5|nr:DUF4129 domain-containing protein [Halomicroarcula sp. GDY20]
MTRQPSTTATLTLIAVLAVALAAVTLPSAVDPSLGAGSGSGAPGGGSGDGGLAPPTADDSRSVLPPLPWVTDLMALLLAAAVAVTVGSLLWDRRGLARVVAVVATVVGGLWLAAALLGRGGSGRVPGRPLGGNVSLGGSETVGSTGTVAPSALLVLALVPLAVGLALVAREWHSTDADDDEPVAERGDTGGTTAEAVGAAAGRAADRVADGATLDNEVYRAWHEMTALLDVSDPSTTPGEFRAAAVDAGMDPDAVDELTALFERVRYGGADRDPVDAERAVELLRRVEATHAEDRD